MKQQEVHGKWKYHFLMGVTDNFIIWNTDEYQVSFRAKTSVDILSNYLDMWKYHLCYG